MRESLEKAIKELPSSERSSLINQIQANLEKDIFSEDQGAQGGLGGYSSLNNSLPDFITERLREDLASEPFYRRFWFILKSYFSSMSVEDIYKEYILNIIAYRNSKTSLRMFLDLKEKKVKPAVFRRIYTLNQQAQEVSSFFTYISSQEVEAVMGMYNLIKSKVVGPKELLSDFFTNEELDQILVNPNYKIEANFKVILEEKVDNYLKLIHSQVFELPKKELYFFNLLQSLALYPYDAILKTFLENYESSLERENEESLFALAQKGASFGSFITSFEKLASLIDTFSPLSFTSSLLNEIAKSYYNSSKESLIREGFSTEEAFEESLNQKVSNFYNAIILFDKIIPLEVFVKVLKGNPYYEIHKIKEASFSIKDLYKDVLMAMLLREWRENQGEMKRSYWDKRITKFLSEDALKDLNEKPFDFISEEDYKIWWKTQFLHFFLAKYSDSMFSYVLKALSHVVFTGRSSSKNQIEVLETSLGEFSKMERVNFSFVAKDKKEFLRKIIGNTATEKDKQLSLEVWLSKMNEKNLKILNDFDYFFTGLRDFFNQIKESNELTESLNISYNFNGKKLSIKEALNLCIHILDEFFIFMEEADKELLFLE